MCSRISCRGEPISYLWSVNLHDCLENQKKTGAYKREGTTIDPFTVGAKSLTHVIGPQIGN